jgi:hypothetical protein
MGKDAMLEYIETLRKRYIQSTKIEKNMILSEFCATSQYDRKYAIKLLGGKVASRSKQSGPKPVYDSDFMVHLVCLWTLMRRMCSKRMKAAIPQWLDYYRSETLTIEIRNKLMTISPSSIDRLLKPYKIEFRKGLSATKAGAFLKSQIPIELIDRNVDQPGYVEADTVAHCGSSLSGEFGNTLTMTDLLSGWTGNRCTLGKASADILDKIKEIRSDFPFKMLGFACDNGSEFINYDLVNYMEKNKEGKVKFVRRRPYKKNDAAHVEQKNDATVRQLIGYSRIESREIVTLVNEIYRDYWNPFLNFFCPVMKLKHKVRIGGRIRKVYDTPKTPYHRLINHPALSELEKQSLKTRMEGLDPIRLAQGLQKKLDLLFKLFREGSIKSKNNPNNSAA